MISVGMILSFFISKFTVFENFMKSGQETVTDVGRKTQVAFRKKSLGFYAGHPQIS